MGMALKDPMDPEQRRGREEADKALGISRADKPRCELGAVKGVDAGSTGSHFNVSVRAAWGGGWQAEFNVGVQSFSVGPEYETFTEAQWMRDQLRKALGKIANNE